ncbi:hypothetical protein ACFV2D_14635 [Streptomyces capillispiralis]|uniref:hypothetical protein n=1 Tax=Streptomyces capillispiralis TaxID=68182 RepID=UPI0036C6405E
MTTFSSSSSSSEPVIPAEAAASEPPSATTVTATGTHRLDPARPRRRSAEPADRTHPVDAAHPYDPVATVDLVDPLESAQPPDPVRPPGPANPEAPVAGKPYGDPVSDLVHAAVSDRPLEEVVDLITALERSPEHARAVVDALRAAGVGRSVEDVTRLVARLTRPPRDADSADETIRAAAAHRSVEDVTRLVALLHSEPLAPHCREEALRAAATGRSVDELVELIDRLAAHRPPEPPGRRVTGSPSRTGPEDGGKPEAARRPGRLRSAAREAGPRRPRRPRPAPSAGPGTGRFRLLGTHTRDRTPEPVNRPVVWSGWIAATALAVCAVLHFPLRSDGVPLRLHALAVGLSVLCTVLALILMVRPGAMALVGAFVVPAVLAGAHAYGGSFPSAALPRAVDLALAPPWIAVTAAAAAALLALAALVVRVASPLPAATGRPGRRPRPAA